MCPRKRGNATTAHSLRIRRGSSECTSSTALTIGTFQSSRAKPLESRTSSETKTRSMRASSSVAMLSSYSLRSLQSRGTLRTLRAVRRYRDYVAPEGGPARFAMLVGALLACLESRNVSMSTGTEASTPANGSRWARVVSIRPSRILKGTPSKSLL